MGHDISSSLVIYVLYGTQLATIIVRSRKLVAKCLGNISLPFSVLYHPFLDTFLGLVEPSILNRIFNVFYI